MILNLEGGDIMNISKSKLEIAIANARISNKELSKLSGIRQETIARIKKNGNANPLTIGRLAKALDVRVEELIETTAATVNQEK